jgi:hypothetical protein
VLTARRHRKSQAVFHWRGVKTEIQAGFFENCTRTSHSLFASPHTPTSEVSKSAGRDFEPFQFAETHRSSMPNSTLAFYNLLSEMQTAKPLLLLRALKVKLL